MWVCLTAPINRSHPCAHEAPPFQGEPYVHSGVPVKPLNETGRCVALSPYCRECIVCSANVTKFKRQVHRNNGKAHDYSLYHVNLPRERILHILYTIKEKHGTIFPNPLPIQKDRQKAGLFVWCSGEDLNLHAREGATTSR